MRVVELFAGIGGFRAGFQDAADESNRVVSFPFVSEWDKFAQKSYEAIWGEVPHGDITKIEAKDIPDHDILVGGFPCQAFSIAGNMKGFEDARGTLFFDMARIAKEKQPKAILMENVKGLVGHDKGNTLEVMARTLWDIGYRIDFDILNSCMFGVPQNRERIFIVAIRKDLINKQEWVTKGTTVVPKGKKRISVIENADTFNFPYPTGFDNDIGLRDVLEPEVDVPTALYIGREETEKLLAELEPGELQSTVGPPIKEVAKLVCGVTVEEGGINALEMMCANQSIVMPVLTPERATKRQNGRRFKGNGDDAFALTTQDRHGVLIAQPKMLGLLEIKGTEQVRRVYDINGLSPTLTTMQGGNQEPKVLVGLRIRKLTPLECWRLQAFDDDMFYRAKNAGVSNSQLYKQAGNSVTTTVIKEIALKLFDLLDAVESGELAPPPGQTNIFDFI